MPLITSHTALSLSELDSRARDIFAQIVDAYLETGQPVGSRTLSKTLSQKSGLNLSAASVRNVMADLAGLGLLSADHISAGRRPTHQGLRLFVDGLLEIGDLSATERKSLEAQIAAENKDAQAIMSQAGSLLSGLAGGAGLVLSPARHAALKHVEFVAIDQMQALAVLVHEDGHVENRLMPVPSGLLPSTLERAGNYLSARLKGRTLNMARLDILREISEGRAALDAAASKLAEAGLAQWSGTQISGQKRSLIVRGRSRLLDNVDAQTDLERIQHLFEDLEHKEDLIALLDRAETAEGVKIFIGSENPLFSLSGSSVVVAPYRDASQNIIGAVGVIGPTRLNYARVIPMVDYTAKIVGQLLKGPGL